MNKDIKAITDFLFIEDNINDIRKSDVAKERVYAELERIGKYLIKGDLDIK